jgi:hypothetical protein
MIAHHCKPEGLEPDVTEAPIRMVQSAPGRKLPGR